MAQDINSVIINGRLVKDAEVKTTKGGLAIAVFSIASNYAVKKADKWEEESNFFDVKLMGVRADSLKPHLLKGKAVTISGELRQERWEQDGQARSRVVIMARDIQLLSSGQATDATPKAPQPKATPTASPRQMEPIDDPAAYDDIPF